LLKAIEDLSIFGYHQRHHVCKTDTLTVASGNSVHLTMILELKQSTKFAYTI